VSVPELYNAARIAAALGLSKRGIAKAMARIEPAGCLIVRGQKADAWRIEQMPENYRVGLLKNAAEHHSPNVAHLLGNPPEPWQPRKNGEVIRMSAISGQSLDAAARLKRALQPSLQRLSQGGPNVASIESTGLADYCREFGYSIKARHWRSLIERTQKRDAGAGDWERIEIYLPERVKTERKTLKIQGIAVDTLENALRQIAAPDQPSNGDKDQIWIAACDQMADLLAAEISARDAKWAILRRLDQWGHLAATTPALRRSFERKWLAFQEAGGDAAAIRDGRTLRFAMPAEKLPEEDRKKLIARSLDCGGRLAQGWRECLQEGELSPDVTARFIQNPRSKSYVPGTVRREVRPDIDLLMPLHHGPREAELSGPHFRRDYAGMHAGDSFQADDCTNPVYYWEPDVGSPHGYRILRGQFILMIDERCLLPLGYALHSEATYNSRIIRSLITRVHDDYGLPRKRFYFENGIWKAKLLRGDEVEAAHTEKGLREFGIRFQHAKLPRAKVVERVLGLVQDRMERLPGYVGRDEIHDRFERIQDKLNQAKNGKLHPSSFLLSKDDYCFQLDTLLEAYAREPQQGGILDGLSPVEAWNRFQSPEPMVRLGGMIRYLLAHHRLPLKVQKSTITLRSSLGGGRYCNEHTGRFDGQRVLVWVDPEHLDCVGITSMDQKEGPFIVQRLEDIPAIDAAPELIAAGKRQIADAMSYSKTLYRSVSAKFTKHNFRKLMVDPATLKRGEEFDTQQKRVRSERKDAGAKMRGVREAARELGVMPKRVTPETLNRMAEGMELMREAKELQGQGEPSQCATATAPAKVKKYVLKTPAALPARKQLLAAYWRTWKEIEKSRPGTSRHAITHRVLGSVRKVGEQSEAELAKMVHAFASIMKGIEI
jgi:hypothetical protein